MADLPKMNFDKWRLLTDGLPSPDNFIDWGWLFMISSALQRRIWMPPAHDRVYPNMYVIPVGKPGTGKGGPIRTINSILSELYLEVGKNENPSLTADEKVAAEVLAANELKEATKKMLNGSSKQVQVEKPLLIPNGGDATTYEALMRRMAESYRYIPYKGYDAKLQKERMFVYGHCSMYFCLEEMSSLLKKNTDSLLNFLIQAYDCGEEYLYETKHQGKDRIRRLCLNFMAGTTPETMQNLFDNGILGTGFSSRVFFIYASKNRKTVFFRPELTEEQIKCREALSKHAKALTTLYGQVRLDDKTPALLEKWLHERQNNPHLRASRSSKLEAYYARENIHLMKVVCARHFGESLDMYIPHSEFEAAIEFKHEAEKTMHLALCMGGGNPMSKVAPQIKSFLEKTGRHTFKECWAEMFEKLPRKNDIEECLNYLLETNQIRMVTDEDEVTKEKTLFYAAMV